MKIGKSAVIIILGCGSLITVGHGQANAPCAELGSTDKARLADYVERKYQVPAGIPLNVSEISRVGSSCYRRLLFRAANPLSTFRIELLASPDFLFLTRELMDSRVDPIQEELRRRQAVAAGMLRGGPPAMGPETAPATLAIFSDFQCPYCSRMADTVRDVVAEQGDHVRIIYRYFPLTMHPWARPAAEAAACAQQQGSSHFWNVHDFLFTHQRELTSENLREKLIAHTADLAGFDKTRFAECLLQRKTAKTVDEDLRLGGDNGVHATPTVFLNGAQLQVSGPEQLKTLIRELSADPRATVPDLAGQQAAPLPAANAGTCLQPPTTVK